MTLSLASRALALTGLALFGPAAASGLSSTSGLSSRTNPASDNSTLSPAYRNSWLYEFGFYGGYPTQTFQSFAGTPPRPNIVRDDARCHDGDLVFVSPRGHYVADLGPMVLDSYGNLVWMDTAYGQAMGMDMQMYRGKPYLTFWAGGANGTFGRGDYLMINQSYQLEHVVSAAAPYAGDLHEFKITPNNTALITAYQLRSADLSAFGTRHGWIYDGVFQEIDIATNTTLFTWRAADHFNLTDSWYHPAASGLGSGRTPTTAWDFFHINAVDKDDHGNYIVSSRYMCAVACISKDDGRVLWQLGGPRNSFADLSAGAATRTRWQHHVRWHGRGLVSIFNNNAVDSRPSAWSSSGLVVQLDTAAMTARLVHRYASVYHILAGSQGSVQLDVARDRAVVGWGYVPAYTQLTLAGAALCETHIGPVRMQNFGWVKNYRTFKHPWTGQPRTPPTLVWRRQSARGYVSWNGATEVHRWELQTADTETAAEWSVIDTAVRRGRFEVALDARAAHTYIRAVAYDAAGAQLGVSATVQAGGADTPTPAMASPMHQQVPRHPWVIVAGYAGWAGAVAVVAYVAWRRGLGAWVKRAMGVAREAVAGWRWKRRSGPEYEAVPLVGRDE